MSILKKKKVSRFDASNTATHGNTVTINEKSGEAIFTDNIAAGTGSELTVNNDKFKVGQKINPELEYDFQGSGNGFPILMGYTMTAGQCIFNVLNVDQGVDAGSPKIIRFQIS